LRDSIALLEFLDQAGLTAHLVFGVIADPFAAHCWVQTPELILNESVDTAGLFQPILAI
jgi:hypothetical protein